MKLETNPADLVTVQALLQIYLVDLADSKRAVALAEKVSDVAMKKRLALLAKKPSDLEEAKAAEMATWFRSLAIVAKAPINSRNNNTSSRVSGQSYSTSSIKKDQVDMAACLPQRQSPPP